MYSYPFHLSDRSHPTTPSIRNFFLYVLLASTQILRLLVHYGRLSFSDAICFSSIFWVRLFVCPVILHLLLHGKPHVYIGDPVGSYCNVVLVKGHGRNMATTTATKFATGDSSRDGTLLSEEYTVKALPGILNARDLTALFVLLLFFVTNVPNAVAGGAAGLTLWIVG